MFPKKLKVDTLQGILNTIDLLALDDITNTLKREYRKDLGQKMTSLKRFILKNRITHANNILDNLIKETRVSKGFYEKLLDVGQKSEGFMKLDTEGLTSEEIEFGKKYVEAKINEQMNTYVLEYYNFNNLMEQILTETKFKMNSLN